jgi:hypothetical protein
MKIVAIPGGTMKTRLFFKAVLAFVLFVGLMPSSAFPYAWLNYSEGTFNKVNNSITSSDIISGAEYYLKAYSDFLLFSNRIEVSEINGIDYTELTGAIDPVIASLERASLILKTINQKTAITPYNPSVVDKLIAFDYDGFCKARGLNSIILTKVRRYLSIGDVRGLYSQAFSDIDAMLSQLAGIKKSLEEKTFPDISSIWMLNQRFSEILLFGQYTSQVFKEISAR